jgi:hypothetical protein
MYSFWRARVCWPLLCLCRPFCIFERCLDSNPESCRSKQHFTNLATHLLDWPSHPSPWLSHPSSFLSVLNIFDRVATYTWCTDTDPAFPKIGSRFRMLRLGMPHFAKILISGMGKNQDLGSGLNIPDPQHCFFSCFGVIFALLQPADKRRIHADPDPKHC